MSPTARASRLAGERARASGTSGSMRRGSGREPITLSTAILSGSGANSARGANAPATRAARPPAEAQERGTRAVTPEGHEPPGRAERPATDLKVPAVVVAPAPNHGAGGPEVRFEMPESLVGILPALAPEGERPWPRRREPRRPPPPGHQAVLQPATQARQRLEQVERRCEQPSLQPGRTAGRRVVERRARRTEGSLRHRPQGGGDEAREQGNERAPGQAQRRQGPPDRDQQIP